MVHTCSSHRLALVVVLIVIFVLVIDPLNSIKNSKESDKQMREPSNLTTIIVVTPTHKRPERLADMISLYLFSGCLVFQAHRFRLSQTLSHVSRLHWIVVEDGEATVPAVSRILQRSGVPHIYLATTSSSGMPRRGWTHRNVALQYVRENYDKNRSAVLYFADDDNTYDIRLFNNYIRKVMRIGVWAVGDSQSKKNPISPLGGNMAGMKALGSMCRVRVTFAAQKTRACLYEGTIPHTKRSTWSFQRTKFLSRLVGGAWVEAPHVSSKGKVIAWDVMFAPGRPFATDMAGFAINIRELFRARDASFNQNCAKTYKQGPESCFLSQFGFRKEDLEPFGYKDYPKEILVWHTKTSKSKTRGPKRGYAIESNN